MNLPLRARMEPRTGGCSDIEMPLPTQKQEI